MIKHITESEALYFVSKQEKKDQWHNDFYFWKLHLIALKNWPWLKKFYRGGKWLGHFDDLKLNGVYWYNLIDDETQKFYCQQFVKIEFILWKI